MATVYNTITATFVDGERAARTDPINYQYDAVQYLAISGIDDLPDYYEVDFCNDGDDETISIPPTTGKGFQIPDDYLLTGKPVKGYIVITGEDTGAVETRYEITIPVRGRPARTDINPTEAEQLQIDTLIAAMNDATERSETAATEAEASAAAADGSAQDAEAWAVGQRNGVDVDSDDETYNNNAKYYANVAQQGAEESGYVWFDVHDDDGHMYVYITENLSGDVSFEVDEETGILEVVYT